MGKKTSSQKDRINRALYSAARSLGWLFPQTEDEVVSAGEPPDSVPSSDPFEALDREPLFSKRLGKPAEAVPEYEEELRRAARLGAGEIPEEVEERMRRDRRRAEEEADGN